MAAEGKLLLYSAPSFDAASRVEIVRSAVRRVAEKLDLKMEVAQGKSSGHVFVYYKSDMGDEIPIYSDFGKEGGVEDVYRAIVNMMFVLSFHPKHSVLKTIRGEVMRFS